MVNVEFKTIASVLVIFATVASSQLNRRLCGRLQYPCEDGGCIPKQAWCDGIIHCHDKSDETHCTGNCITNDQFFKCLTSGKCLPSTARCDNVIDCSDASDEKNCISPETSIRAQTEVSAETTQAVSKAVMYLLKQRRQNNGWENAVSSSRANIALHFVSNQLPWRERKLMKRDLVIQLTLDLIAKTAFSLGHLALYVNALITTGNDPRNFQGADLVGVLRVEADKVKGENFRLPYALLTLCIADEHVLQDEVRLAKTYSSVSNVGFQSMAVLAMECLRRKTGFSGHKYVNDFFVKLISLDLLSLSLHEKALVTQAANAVGHEIPPLGILTHQKDDGSFGDILGTYYCLPALLGTSLLDLGSDYSQAMTNSLRESDFAPDPSITYSLWVSTEHDIKTQSLMLPYRNLSFVELMNLAQAKDPNYEFSCDRTQKGYEVVRLSGIANDEEIGIQWKLYLAVTESITINSISGLVEQKESLSKIYPKPGSHYIFYIKL